MHGPAASSLLFSNGMEYGSSIVPSGAYVQLWGCLEPTTPRQFTDPTLGTAVSGLSFGAVPGEEQRR